MQECTSRQSTHLGPPETGDDGLIAGSLLGESERAQSMSPDSALILGAWHGTTHNSNATATICCGGE